MMRHVLFVVVGATLIAFGVVFLLGCGSGCTMGTWHVNTQGRTVVDGVELPHVALLKTSVPQPLSRLSLAFDSASVVIDGDATVTGVEAEYDVRERTPGDASLVIDADGIAVKSASGSPVLVTSARIRVPPGTPVRVTTALGSVKVAGIRGVDEVRATTNSGEVELASLADVAKLVAEADLGRVTLEGASGVASISLTANAGDVVARDVTGARDVALRTDLGSIRAESIEASASLRCETDTGEAQAQDVKTPDLRLQSDVGAVRATRCAVGHLYAHTNVGAVNLESCTYKTKDVGSDLGGVGESK